MTPEQGRLDLGKFNAQQFEPVRAAAEGAFRFTQRRYNPAGLDQMHVNPETGFRIQAAYRRAQAAPEEAPGIRESYGALRDETNKQYAHMTGLRSSGGMGLHHEVVPHDPYPTAEDMAADVRQGRIRTMASESTGGHAFFSHAENNRFRAVHDVFGHAATGRGFSRHGEEAAYQSHAQMFSPEALPALTSETRGQNSFLNFSPQGGFPEQESKLIGLPEWASSFRDRRPGRSGTGVFRGSGQAARR